MDVIVFFLFPEWTFHIELINLLAESKYQIKDSVSQVSGSFDEVDELNVGCLKISIQRTQWQTLHDKAQTIVQDDSIMMNNALTPPKHRFSHRFEKFLRLVT